MMNAVGPRIRRRLLLRMQKQGIDTAGLRSFMDPPKQRGKTVKGSGQVGYAEHKRNSMSMALTGTLRKATQSYLEDSDHLQSMRIDMRVKIIGNRISINGRCYFLSLYPHVTIQRKHAHVA